jgi:histidinol-phosphate aminotransferase
MNLKKPKALIFDIDDTLVNTTMSYRLSIIQTALHWGVNVTQADIAKIKAAGDANNDWEVTRSLIVKKGIDVSIQEVTKVFEKFYQGDGKTPGLKLKEELLLDVQDIKNLADNFELGIVTGRPRKDVYAFFEQFNLNGLFKGFVSMDDAALKPSPEPVEKMLAMLGTHDAWMIGDTPDDIRSAKDAGIIAMGTLAPADDKEAARAALYSCGAAMVFEKVTQFYDFMKK